MTSLKRNYLKKTLRKLSTSDSYRMLRPAAPLQTRVMRGEEVETFNPRQYGGGLVHPPPPLRFFADSEKTAARNAAGFWLPYGANLPQFLPKKLTGSGQVTEL